MRQELQLYGYVIVRPSPKHTHPWVLLDMGWDTPEEVLEYVNLHAMLANAGEMFVTQERNCSCYTNHNRSATLIIGQLDCLMRELLNHLHKSKSIVWAALMDGVRIPDVATN